MLPVCSSRLKRKPRNQLPNAQYHVPRKIPHASALTLVSGSLYVSLRGNGSRWIYSAEAHVAMIWLRYALLLLIVPCYFIALSRRWWTTMPLWLVSTSVMLTQYLIAAQHGVAVGSGTEDNSLIYVGEMTKIMLIPIGVQIAVALRGLGFGAGSHAKHGSQRLAGAFDAAER
jgi:hypothetical protein